MRDLESDDRADPVCIEVLMSSLLAPGLGGWGGTRLHL
jgi:hypothetical protein